jgi:NAD(P)-dependent dehydrogenase (short-subunit alcohol dehydrogenase family)
MLADRVAVIFAATGAIGGAVARRFAREGAHVFASGRNAQALEALAGQIRREGGKVEVALVDATDEQAVEKQFAEVMKSAGRIDVVLNAIGIRVAEGAYGTPCTALRTADFMLPIERHLGSQFLTSRTAVRYMAEARRGTVLTLSASIGKEARPFMAGCSAACAGVEALTRVLASEVAPLGVRVLCLRPGAILETRTIQETIAANAKSAGIPVEAFTDFVVQGSLMHRTPTLDEVAGVAALLASDRASCMTGQVINASCGLVLH